MSFVVLSVPSVSLWFIPTKDRTMKLPQLSLRDLFWLVALVAMGCGWWVEWNKSRQLRSDLEHYKEAWRLVNLPGNRTFTDPLSVPLP